MWGVYVSVRIIFRKNCSFFLIIHLCLYGEIVPGREVVIYVTTIICDACFLTSYHRVFSLDTFQVDPHQIFYTHA